jgi:flagellar hook-length control protein FliK
MTPTNLPVQPATPATPATPGAAATPGTVATEQAQTTDFLMMLGQLVAASVQRSGAGLTPTGKVPPMILDGKKQDEIDPAELVAMFSMGLPQQQPVINIDVPVDVPVEQALQSLPGIGVGSDALTGPLQGILQEAAKEATEGKLAADVAQILDATQTPDSLQGPTAPFQLQPQQIQGQQAAPHTQSAVTHTVHSPVGSAAWADEVGTRVVMMTESGNHTASLKLSPEHLGPLEINITVRDDKASVWFGAAHADTRAAIETALPRLREMFESQGLSLADAGVFREPPREQPAVKNDSMSAGQSDVAEEVTSVNVRARLGLVDAYA